MRLAIAFGGSNCVMGSKRVAFAAPVLRRVAATGFFVRSSKVGKN